MIALGRHLTGTSVQDAVDLRPLDPAPVSADPARGLLLLALLAAAAAAGLTWLSRRNAAEAALDGLATFDGGIRSFDWLIS